MILSRMETKRAHKRVFGSSGECLVPVYLFFNKMRRLTLVERADCSGERKDRRPIL
jgi:hypothetical protein